MFTIFDLMRPGAGMDAMARQFGVPFLGAIPLVRAIRAAGDRGVPIVVADPQHPQSRAFIEIAGAITTQLDERAAGMPAHFGRSAWNGAAGSMLGSRTAASRCRSGWGTRRVIGLARRSARRTVT